jgi:hypothetical protein
MIMEYRPANNQDGKKSPDQPGGKGQRFLAIAGSFLSMQEIAQASPGPSLTVLYSESLP